MSRGLRSISGGLSLLALGGMLAIATAPASATISNVIFKVRAESSLGVAEREFLFADGAYGPPGTFNWDLMNSGGTTDLVDNGNVIATLEEASTTIVETPNPGVPYRVRTGFVLWAGQADTTITITSALLEVPEVDAAFSAARATANITLTDGPGGNGSHLDPLNNGGTSVFGAHYNGLYPGGTMFAGLLGGLIIGPGGGSASASESQPLVGFTPLGEDVFSLSNGWKFLVTTGDKVSGNGQMLIIPEPVGLGLLVVGAALVFRRR